jgi:hypothetical protein
MPDVETNPLFPLLTDALRAGPGSPEWHQAVAKLRTEGLADSDEYRLLVTVREHLASGRDYKSIRAGAGFTRKVLESVERERQSAGKRPSGVPIATIIAAVSIIAVLGVLAYVGYRIFRNPPSSQQGTATDLEMAYFPKVQQSAAFDGGLPGGWKEVGSARLPLKADKTGLRPGSPEAGTPTTNPADTIGRAVVSTNPVGVDEPFSLEVKLKPGRPTEDLIVEIFVSSEQDFSADKSTSSKELIWLLKGSLQQVRLRGGESTGSLFEGPRPESPPNPAGPREPVTIRINVNRDFAVAFNGAQRLWSGANGLAGKARTVGVRFLCVDPSKPVTEPPVVQSIRVLTK